MHPDLVRPARLEPQADERPAAGDAFHAVMRPGGLPVRADAPPGAFAQPGDGRVNDPFRFPWSALGDGQVFAPEGAAVQLLCQQPLGMVVPRDGQKAAGALVQPVHGMITEDSGIFSEEHGQPFPQGIAPLMAAGKRRQGSALADDDQVAVQVAHGAAFPLR